MEHANASHDLCQSRGKSQSQRLEGAQKKRIQYASLEQYIFEINGYIMGNEKGLYICHLNQTLVHLWEPLNSQ